MNGNQRVVHFNIVQVHGIRYDEHFILTNSTGRKMV